MRGDSIPVDGRSVAGNNFRIRSGQGDHFGEAREHPVKASAVHAIDVRISDRAVEIARHDHVRVVKVHHRVAVGVSLAGWG